MTEKMTIKKLSKDPSKQEEIAFFNEIAESIPEFAYLKNFFRPVLSTWVESQIRSDFTADIMEFFEGSQSDNSDLRNKLAIVERARELEVESLKKSNQILQDGLNTMSKTVEYLEKKANDEIYAHNGTRIELIDTEREMEVLLAKITSLKAELYDFMKREAK